MDNEEGQTGEGGDGVRTFTQEAVDKMFAKKTRQLKELEASLAAAPKQESIDSLQQKLEALAAEGELAGKSELEKLQHQHVRELEKMGIKNNQLQTDLKARDVAVEAAQGTLQRERMSRAFGQALAKAEVFPKGASDALAVLLTELKDAEVDDNGAVTASYGGDLIDETPETIATRFLADRPYFALARGGGSGQRAPSGGQTNYGKEVIEMTIDELAEAAGPDPKAHS